MTGDQLEGGLIATTIIAFGTMVSSLIKTLRGDGNARIKADVSLRKIDLEETEQINAHEIRLMPIVGELLTKEIAKSEKLQLSVEKLSADLRKSKLNESESSGQIKQQKDEITRLTDLLKDQAEQLVAAQTVKDEVRLLQSEKRILEGENARLRDEYRAAKLLYRQLLPTQAQNHFTDETESGDDEVDTITDI